VNADSEPTLSLLSSENGSSASCNAMGFERATWAGHVSAVDGEEVFVPNVGWTSSTILTGVTRASLKTHPRL
jgi:hypothetical protein